MDLYLNPYVSKFTEKWLQPLLIDTGCSQKKLKLNPWWFEKVDTPQDTEWPRLVQHKLKVESNEKKEREIIPVN